jgi:hypothetical protein
VTIPRLAPGDRRVRPRATDRTARLVVGAAALTAVALVALLGRMSTTDDFWLAALWVVWAGGLVWALTRRPVSLAFVVLAGWQFLYLVIGATTASFAGQTEIGSWTFRAGVTPAVRMVTLCFAAVWAGAAATHLTRRGRAHGRATVAVRPTQVRVPPWLTARRLDRWALVLVVIAAASLLLYVRLAGASLADLNVVAGDATYGDLARAGDGAAVKYFKTLNELAGVALILLALRITVVSRAQWLRPVLIGAVAGALLIMSGGRAWLFVPVFAAAALVWTCADRSWVRHSRRWLVLGGAVAFALAAFVGGIRGSSDRGLDGEALVTKEVIGIFPPTAGLAETIPRQMDHLGPSSYLEVVALPVPRALWPDKPDTVLGDVQLAIFGKAIGASFGFHGELFAAFGMVGVAIGSFVFGALYEGAWRALVRARTLPGALLVAVALAVLLQIFSRGYVAGQLAGQFGLVLGALVVAALIRRGERKRAAAPGALVPRRSRRVVPSRRTPLRGQKPSSAA